MQQFSEPRTAQSQFERDVAIFLQRVLGRKKGPPQQIDINQRLALLAISIDRLEGTLPDAAEIRQEIGKAGQDVRSLANDIQALSHRLHSSKLEYMGLTDAVAGFCGELSDQHGWILTFTLKISQEGCRAKFRRVCSA